MSQKPWVKNYPEGCHDKVDFAEVTHIADQLQKACQTFGDKRAMSCPIAFFDIHMTFTEFNENATRFAAFLQNELGIKKGDRVAIMLPNLMQFPVVFFGVQKVGAICVNTNPLYTEREMLHQFKDSGAETIIILDLLIDKLDHIIKDTKIKNVVTTSIGDHLPFFQRKLMKVLLKIKKQNVPNHSISVHQYRAGLESTGEFKSPTILPEDLAVIQYTGGTTGVSKGAMLTHGNILGDIAVVKEYIKKEIPNAKHTVLTALPLYHIFALTVNYLTFLLCGQHIVLVPKPIPISNTLKVFKKYPITVMTGVSTLYNTLNNSPGFGDLTKGTLQFAVAGGMALHREVAQSFKKITGLNIIEGFGLTEASPATHLNPLDGRERLGSIGLPLPGTNSRIVTEDGKDVPAGEVGELVISGPQVMKGYWQRPDETAKTIKNGELWTGDMAKMDEDGFFYIVDRKKDMILVSGFNVYPNEIEDVLCMHPKVMEAAAIGVEDKASGESVKAYVVKKDPSLTEAELREHCRENLTGYKRPRVYEFKTELPKSNIGKVLRRHLKDENEKKTPAAGKTA